MPATLPHIAANIAEIPETEFTPELAQRTCRGAQAMLQYCGQHAWPGSELENNIEIWADRIEKLADACTTPIIIAGWESEGYRSEFYRQCSEIEERAYNAVLADLERLEPDNPLCEMVAAYQATRRVMIEQQQPTYRRITAAP